MLKFLLPVASLALLVFATAHISTTREFDQIAQPPLTPSRSPYTAAVAAAGMIEAQTDNIKVGSPIPGVVAEVYVKVGQSGNGQPAGAGHDGATGAGLVDANVAYQLARSVTPSPLFTVPPPR